MSKLGDVLSKLVELKHITEGACLRAEHPAAWRFFVIFFWKNNYLIAIGLHFARVQSHVKELNF